MQRQNKTKHLKILITLICAVFAFVIIILIALCQSKYVSTVTYDINILYRPHMRTGMFIKLSRNGECQVYYGAFFYKNQSFEYPLGFYDVKKRRLLSKHCEQLFDYIDTLEKKSEIVSEEDMVSWYKEIDDSCLGVQNEYIAINVGEKWYTNTSNEEYKDEFLQLCEYICKFIPKRYKHDYLKMYDSNGDLVPLDF